MNLLLALGLTLWLMALVSTTLWAAVRARPYAERVIQGRPQLSCVRDRTEHKTAQPLSAVRVLVVRPCAGLEPYLEQCLSSTLDAHCSSVLMLAMVVQSSKDLAVPAANRVCVAAKSRHVSADLFVTGARGPNCKASQIASVLDRIGAGFDILVLADSDVDLTGVDLDALVAPLTSSGDLGAVWAPPVEAQVPITLADRASHAVLGGSLHAFALLAGIDRKGMVGKLLALRPQALAEVGGFGSLVRYLGEDMELARRLNDQGWHMQAAPFVVPSRGEGRSWGDVVQRYTRWLCVIRAQRTALLVSYPLLFCPLPLLAILSALAGCSLPVLAVMLALMGVSARLGVALIAQRVSRRRVSLLAAAIDISLADLLLTLAWSRAVFARRVRWRGRILRIHSSGLLHCEESR